MTERTDPQVLSYELRMRELHVREMEIKLASDLKQLGLRGTLTGAIGGMLLVVLLAGISVYSGGIVITGTHLCILVGILCASVTFFGAFVFDRAATVVADVQKGHVRVEAPTERPRASREE